MNLMEHLQPHVIIPLKIGGIDISITNAVVSIWVACYSRLSNANTGRSNWKAHSKGVAELDGIAGQFCKTKPNP